MSGRWDFILALVIINIEKTDKIMDNENVLELFKKY